MKKTLLVMAMAIALVLSMMAAALAADHEKGADRVTICHVNEANDVVYGGAGNAIYLGRLITVSEHALDAHLAHGDSETDELGDLGGLITPETSTVKAREPGWQWTSIMANAYEQDADVVNANCAFRLAD